MSIENPTVGWCIVLASDEMETVLAEAAFIEVTGIEELDGLLRLWVADERDAGELGVRLSRWHPCLLYTSPSPRDS